MVFQADGLWWQPHGRAYAALISGSLAPLENTKQQAWLLGLLAKFKPPSAASKAAIEKERHLEAGGKKAV
eukprot:scaffold294416_cov41-Prasinocladus_malaysianus.AAC.1